MEVIRGGLYSVTIERSVFLRSRAFTRVQSGRNERLVS